MLIHRIILALVLSALVCLPAAAQEDAQQVDPLREAVRSMSDALGDVANDEEAVKLLEGFLDEHPDTRYTSSVLNAIVYYLGEKLGDRDRAIAIIKGHIPKINELDNLKSTKVVLAGAYNKPRYRAELRNQIEDLEEYESLDFSQHETLINAAFGTEDWELALELCDRAAPAATPEAVKADYPEASEETVKERSKGRADYVNICKSWGLANTGEVDEAISMFEAADESVDLNYFGVPTNEFYVYWGKTLMMKGRNEEALDRLLPAALWAGDEEAVDALREIHGAGGGSDAQFEDFLYEKRLEHAKEIESFAAVDYKGAKHRSEDVMGKVTLVAFWFPT